MDQYTANRILDIKDGRARMDGTRYSPARIAELTRGLCLTAERIAESLSKGNRESALKELALIESDARDLREAITDRIKPQTVATATGYGNQTREIAVHDFTAAAPWQACLVCTLSASAACHTTRT